MKALFSLLVFVTISISSSSKSAVSQQLEFRVSYIFLSGKDLSLDRINILRKTIIDDYKKGVPFKKLAKEYSLDWNSETEGDLGWFPEGRMYPQFENAVRKHSKDDIFTVDIPSREWYYVVLKTHSNRKSN
jgi:parvulin-like peptidyl-prolyl isomerase